MEQHSKVFSSLKVLKDDVNEPKCAVAKVRNTAGTHDPPSQNGKLEAGTVSSKSMPYAIE